MVYQINAKHTLDPIGTLKLVLCVCEPTPGKSGLMQIWEEWVNVDLCFFLENRFSLIRSLYSRLNFGY